MTTLFVLYLVVCTVLFVCLVYDDRKINGSTTYLNLCQEALLSYTPGLNILTVCILIAKLNLGKKIAKFLDKKAF